MARVSRKDPIPKPERAPVETLYNGALYRRLSVEDARHRGRHTLENQKNIVMDYLNQQKDIRLSGIYTDDGESGTSFDRPGFMRLMDDVRTGKINCIIVKDLSRFARDFREAGRYLEQIFPFLGVRFISVNDNYDTAHPRLDQEGIAIPAANLINEMYARDISQKVNSGLKVLRGKGMFLGALAPYGYNKSPVNKHHLVIDPPAAEIVRSIYQWLAEGWSDYKIVHHLNQAGIPAPGRYRYEQGLLKDDKYKNSRLWNRATVKKMVKNRVYVGDMVQGKRNGSYFCPDRGPTQEAAWSVVEHTHEPIVGRDAFDAVQLLLAAREQGQAERVEKNADQPPTQNLLCGLLFCGDCGKPMSRRRRRGGKKHGVENWLYDYRCSTYTNKSPSACTLKTTLERELLAAVFTTVCTQIAAADLWNAGEGVRDPGTESGRLAQIDAEVTRLRRKITHNGTRKRSLYESYSEAALTESEYLSARTECEQEGLVLERRLEELLRQKNDLDERLPPSDRWINAYQKYNKKLELTRPVLLKLVERIDVYDGKRLTIKLKYMDEYRALPELLNGAAARRGAAAV